MSGKYVLTEDDIKAQRQFPDAIATGCWYLDLHPSYATVGSANVAPGAMGGLDGFQPSHYDIPYGALLPRKIENLLVAGRCHSANRDRKSTRLNSSHTVISTLSLHDALPISVSRCDRDGLLVLGPSSKLRHGRIRERGAGRHGRARRLPAQPLRHSVWGAVAAQDREPAGGGPLPFRESRSEEHTSELQSHSDLHSFPTRRSSDLSFPMRSRRAAGTWTFIQVTPRSDPRTWRRAPWAGSTASSPAITTFRMGRCCRARSRTCWWRAVAIPRIEIGRAHV